MGTGFVDPGGRGSWPNGDGVSGFFVDKKATNPVPFGSPFLVNEKKLSIKVLTSNEN